MRSLRSRRELARRDGVSGRPAALGRLDRRHGFAGTDRFSVSVAEPLSVSPTLISDKPPPKADPLDFTLVQPLTTAKIFLRVVFHLRISYVMDRVSRSGARRGKVSL